MIVKSKNIHTLSALFPDASIAHIELILPDINGHLRGKILSVNPDKNLCNYSLLLPPSAICSDFCGNCIEDTGLVWETGDPDYPCTLELESLKVVPWRKDTAQVMLNITTPEGEPVPYEPRNILKNIIQKLENKVLFATAAMELEFTLSRDDDPSKMAKLPISKQTDNRMRLYDVSATTEYKDVFDDIMLAAKEQHVPADSIIAEAAPGQYEINLKHIADPLLAADHAIYLKRIIKAVAAKHNVKASFMAKPYAGYPGNGLHLHVSILNEQGVNIFSPKPDQAYNDALLHAISGIQRTMLASQVLLLPNANSFKRIAKKSYAPSSNHWADNNRNVAIRIPAGPDVAKRIEHRLSGADANPYLLMASVLMGIMHGLDHPEMPTDRTDGTPLAENGTNIHAEPYAALQNFLESDIIATYFGAEFQRVYGICFEAEIARYNNFIMPIEYDWFFESA